MKIIVYIIFIILCSLNLYSQDVSDSIEIRMSNGVQFRQHGRLLTPRKMLEILKEDNAAYSEMVIAKSRYDLSLLVGIPGGFLIGWPIGTYIAGGTPSLRMASVGVALSVLSIAFNLSYNRHARTAAGYYNEGLKLVEGAKTSVNLGLCNHGLGLTVRF